jgi:hypothetical protein
MTRLRSSLGVEMLEHLIMRTSIEGSAIGPSECKKLIERTLDYWSGLGSRSVAGIGIGSPREVSTELVLAWWMRQIKQNAWK